MTGTPSLLKISWLLYKRQWLKFLFFSSCIALGIAFLFSVGNLLTALEKSIASHAQELLAADIEVDANRPFDEKVWDIFNKYKEQGVKITEITSFSSMLDIENRNTTAFLVSVKTIGPAYPFYGALKVHGENYRKKIFSEDSCLIEKSAADQHELKIGDTISLGKTKLHIAGIVLKEPDRSLTRFNLAPRVFISHETLKKSGLTNFGSHIHHSVLFALPPSKDIALAALKFKEKLTLELNDPYIKITSFKDAAPTAKEGFRRVTTFFILVSLITLLLGAAGMSSSISLFLNDQLETVGLLRCLGLGPKAVSRLYHGICLAIGVQGGVLGIIIGAGISLLLKESLKSFFGFTIPINIHFDLVSFLEGISIACLLSLGVTTSKIRSLAHLTPLSILRERINRIPPTPWTNIIALTLGLILIFIYTFLKSNSSQIAIGFSLGLTGAVISIMALIALSLRLLNTLTTRLTNTPFSLRHGLLELSRRQSRTLIFLFTLSSGFSLIGALNIIHNSLSREILLGKAENVPDIFLIDVQKRQLQKISRMVDKYSEIKSDFAPLIRARLTHINDNPIKRSNYTKMTVEEKTRYRFLTREYNLTYTNKINSSEKILAGKFWKPQSQIPEISIERGFSKRTGIKIGDSLIFDIQGRPIKASVTSMRSIKWTSMKPNFFVVLPTYLLENAPQNFITSLKIGDPKKLAAFRQELSKTFPNISVINVHEVLDNVQIVLGVLLKALKVVAWFCVATGLLVLVGTLSLGHKERRKRIALLKALGAKKYQLLLIDFWEFLAIGFLTFFIGSVVAFGLAWFIAIRMDIEFSFDGTTIIGNLAIALFLPLLVGLTVNFRTYGAGVMETLRHEV